MRAAVCSGTHTATLPPFTGNTAMPFSPMVTVSVCPPRQSAKDWPAKAAPTHISFSAAALSVNTTANPDPACSASPQRVHPMTLGSSR